MQWGGTLLLDVERNRIIYFGLEIFRWIDFYERIAGKVGELLGFPHLSDSEALAKLATSNIVLIPLYTKSQDGDYVILVVVAYGCTLL